MNLGVCAGSESAPVSAADATKAVSHFLSRVVLFGFMFIFLLSQRRSFDGGRLLVVNYRADKSSGRLARVRQRREVRPLSVAHGLFPKRQRTGAFQDLAEFAAA
jgi:hypothetical protein